MAKVLKRTWRASPGTGFSRRDRQACSYEAYVPDPLVGRPFHLDGSVVADVADAEAAISRLAAASALVDTEALARLLLRAESVASSYIEGLEVGGRRLLRADAAKDIGTETRDVTADEVLGNIEAMTWSVSNLASAPTVDVDGLLEVHRRLLHRSRIAEHAGQIRTTQNWIGGSSYNPCSAAFVPPPPEYVEELLVDLCAFASSDSLSPVVQAAVAHAQFETIHPFADGNGRVGRVLVHVILRRRGLAPSILPPVSLVLATWSKAYIEGLTATRYRGRPDSDAARAGLDRWIGTFAAACTRSATDAMSLEARIAEISERWRARLGRVRKNSAADLLLAALPGAPIVSTKAAAGLIGRSFQATNEAIGRLESAGILSRVTVGRRNRAFEAKDIIDAFVDLERQLASPAGDTRSAPPSRRAPRRV